MRIAPPQFPPFPDSPRGRFLQRLGHHANVAIIVAFAISVPYGFFALSTKSIAGTAISALTGLTLFGAFCLGFRHDAGICERCIASMPLNASERVQQTRTRAMLRVRHTPLRVFGPVFIAMIAASFIPLHGWHWGAANAFIDIVAGTYWASFYVHRKVEPWCPWCHPRDDGPSQARVPDAPPGNRLPVPAR